MPEGKNEKFSPNGHLLVSALYDEAVRFWGPATDASLQLVGGNGFINRRKFSGDDSYLITNLASYRISDNVHKTRVCTEIVVHRKKQVVRSNQRSTNVEERLNTRERRAAVLDRKVEQWQVNAVWLGRPVSHEYERCQTL